MKKILLTIPLFFLVGCGTNVANLNPFNQPSITQQKMDAQNAWDELDGKNVSVPANKNSSNIKVDTPQLNQVVNSMLETSDTIPDWFYSQPKSNKYFYGAGDGQSVTQAKISALNVIAGELQTAISSTLNINQGTSSINGNNTNFYKDVKQQITTQIAKINFTNIEIMKTLKVNNDIYILLRVNKQKLFNNLKLKFDMLDAKIDNQIKVSKKYSALDQLITINKVQNEIKKALSLANILVVLNSNFDIQNYSNKYTLYLNQKTELLHKLTFGVTSNGLFAQKLIEVLNESGYKVRGNSDIKIKINKQIRNSVTYGMQISRITVNLQVVANGKILSSNSVDCKGISNTKQQAISKAAIDFKQKLQEIGINKLLGFE